MLQILLTVIIAVTITQTIKILLSIKEKKFTWRSLIETGSMPSSHAALVVSLATIIFLTEGLSTTFVIASVLAVIVIRDAIGVRRTAGEEAIALKKILRKTKIRATIHPARGHTPLEVFVGSIIGIAIAIISHFSF